MIEKHPKFILGLTLVFTFFIWLIVFNMGYEYCKIEYNKEVPKQYNVYECTQDTIFIK
jgi:hypothetical protein